MTGGEATPDAGFTGVKQPEFDTLVSKHSSAGSQLDSLASILWAELHKAGLDTSPAMGVREIAKRVNTQAEDLRRRQRLVHEMVRQGVSLGLGLCTPSGNYLAMPDRVGDLMAKLDGRAAAELAERAANGDRTALAQLRKYASQAGNPQFANALLNGLGPKGMVELPASLAKQLRNVLNKEHIEDARALSQNARQVLGMLSTALATGADPKSPAYVGENFLNQLKVQSRADHTVDGITYSGYQSLALIWRAHQDQAPYSPHFMKNIGRDAIVFEREKLRDTWRAAGDPFGEFFGVKKKGMADFATVLSVGEELTTEPGLRADRKGEPFRSSVVDGLFIAAKHDKLTSRALLDWKPAGWSESALTYMLSTRRGAFHDSKNYSPLQSVLEIAIAGNDSKSTELTAEALKAIKKDVAACFGRGSGNHDGKLMINDPEKLEELAILRYPLARALAANMERAAGVYDEAYPGFDGIEKTDLDYLLVHISRDDQAFKELLRAQTGRMRSQINSAAQHHHGNFTENRVLAEASFFGRILEARRLVLMSEGQSQEQAKADLRQDVQAVIGVAAMPVGAAAGKAIGIGPDLGSALTCMTSVDVARWSTDQIQRDHLTPEAAVRAGADDKDIIVKQVGDMVLASRMANGQWTPEDLKSLKGRSFATDSDQPQVKPMSQLSSKDFEALVRWARDRTDVESIKRAAEVQIRNNAEMHDNLGIDRY
jgi:hypothetical protein